MSIPKVQVGIMFEPRIDFELLSPFRVKDTEISGEQTVAYSDGKILWNGNAYEELFFEPLDEEAGVFELKDVTIGIDFHWERKENQRFQGTLKIIVENEKLTAVNILSVEDYLVSVISSEMSATASLELLKAHAVISRSWLLAQIQKNTELHQADNSYSAFTQTADELIRWYDREDHTRFDVCADDHCQRYQGITRASTPIVRQAVSETSGLVLTYKGKICDARFSKSCGGVMEEFSTCWEDTPHPYLVGKRDHMTETTMPDLRDEAEVEKWIRSEPTSFCNTRDPQILSQVLNNYDQETTEFYRWTVKYTQAEISELIRNRSGIDFGDIIDLIPVARGTSGRLYKLKIVGTKRTLTIGKELEIRRTLSPSHLYSSAFIVEKRGEENGLPALFLLHGAGWGHGVGLCQIGAAVMGEKKYPYDLILLHYYVGANIELLYDEEDEED
ncbi:MAG: SpoIID/LytB domain-containing protein [Prevotellaceae bacterium]|jgi:SpoIID/LytB domain protein|nr:SpoIID/LytB domain-containing protein [Prevotellaceae bacterium]